MISGESAGALGVQLWQADILERFKGRYQEKKTIFIADSFLGLQVELSKKSRNICQRPHVPFQKIGMIVSFWVTIPISGFQVHDLL